VDKPEHLRPTQTDQTVVLIAEDDVLIRNVARLVLESEGYFILTAQNGDEALTISRLYPGTIHALLSDVVMPKLDGLKLREMVLKEPPRNTGIVDVRNGGSRRKHSVTQKAVWRNGSKDPAKATLITI